MCMTYLITVGTLHRFAAASPLVFPSAFSLSVATCCFDALSDGLRCVNAWTMYWDPDVLRVWNEMAVLTTSNLIS